MYPNPPSNGSHKLLIAIFLLIGLMIVGGIILAARSSNGGEAAATPIAHSSTHPTYTGFDQFLDEGVSSDQLDGLKYAFVKYLQTTHQTATNIAVVNGSFSPVPHDPTGDSDTINFTASFDGKNSLKATMNYHTLTVVQLLLVDPSTGNQVFDSGSIDLFNQ